MSDRKCPHCGAAMDVRVEVPVADAAPESEALRCPRCGRCSGSAVTGETMMVTTGAGKRLSRPGAERTPGAPRPKMFGRYEILDELGRGGYGVVYKARDPSLDRLVALKVLLAAEHASIEEVERFFREAASTARLEHPGIVPIYEFETFEGRHYYTMAYVEGLTLDRYAEGRSLNARAVLELIEKIALALQHAHSKGIVHRDLKPANVLVSTEGEPRITDFGLAKMLEGEQSPAASRLSRTGVAMGTPQYMSPEQSSGEHRNIDARSDIYSLGCIMYQLLTGEPPFDDPNPVEVLRQHIDDDPRPPTLRGARLSTDVETICLKCLAKEPARRYRTAAELATDIRRFLDGEPVEARRASLMYVAHRKLLRHKAVAIVAAGALAVLAGLTAWYIVALRQRQSFIERELYFSNVGLAHQHALRGSSARADQLLDSCPPRLRGWDWGHVRSAAHEELRDLQLHTGSLDAVLYSPNGRHLVSTGEDGKIIVCDAESGRCVRTIETGQWQRALAVSPDGLRLAAGGGDGSVTLWEFPSGGRLASVKTGEEAVTGLAFDAAGARLAAGLRGGMIRVYALPDCREVLAFQAHPRGIEDGVADLAFSPDGERLATAGGGTDVPIWEAATGRELLRLKGHTGDVICLAFTADGRRLVSGGHDDTAIMWDLATGDALTRFRGHSSAVLGLALDPGGGRLATVSYDRTLRLWELATGNQICRLTGHRNSCSAVAFRPDGSQLATGGDDAIVRVWDARGERSCVFVGGLPGYVRSMAYTPDGRSIALGTNEGSLQLREVPGGREILTLKAHELSVRSVSFSPDGNTLVTAGSDRTIKVWDLERAQPRLTIECPEEREPIAAVTPDGKAILCASQARELLVRSLADGKPLRTLEGFENGAAVLAFDEGGRFAAAADFEGGHVRVWDARSWRLLHSFRACGRTVHGLAFSPEGRRLACATLEAKVGIWDTESGAEVMSLLGHIGQVRAVSFSPDGRRLASGSMDRTVKVWDSATGREILTLEGHAAKVYCVAFSPEGRFLASGARDNTLRIWRSDCADGREPAGSTRALDSTAGNW